MELAQLLVPMSSLLRTIVPVPVLTSFNQGEGTFEMVWIVGIISRKLKEIEGFSTNLALVLVDYFPLINLC